MIEAVISALIYICLLALAVYLVLWVLEALGIGIPEQVKKIIMIIAVLVAILVLIRVLLPGLGLSRLVQAEQTLTLT